MDIFTVALLTVLGGFLYRQRGGGYQLPVHLGTQGVRILFWTLPCAGLFWFLTSNPWIGLASGIMAFAGLMFGHGAHQRSTEPLLTHEPPSWSQTESLTGWLEWLFDYDNLNVAEKELYHWIGMSTINIVRLLILLVPTTIFYLNPWFLAFALIGLVPGYFIGWRIPVVNPNITVYQFLDDGGEWGEFVTGMIYWFAIAAAFASLL